MFEFEGLTLWRKGWVLYPREAKCSARVASNISFEVLESKVGGVMSAGLEGG